MNSVANADGPFFGPALRPASFHLSQIGGKLVEGYEFSIHRRNKDGAISWRCSYGRCGCKAKSSSDQDDAASVVAGSTKEETPDQIERNNLLCTIVSRY